uniref:Uncharacterized protein n=1 Tax=Pararge aegeria TaxID=116150 RepID=S4P4H0_9NEOP
MTLGIKDLEDLSPTIVLQSHNSWSRQVKITMSVKLRSGRLITAFDYFTVKSHSGTFTVRSKAQRYFRVTFMNSASLAYCFTYYI